MTYRVKDFQLVLNGHLVHFGWRESRKWGWEWRKTRQEYPASSFFFKERYLNFHKTLFLHQCKFISLAPVSCNSILSLMSSESKLMHKRNYANKIISNHHCLQKRTTKSCSQKKSIDKDNYIIRLSQSSLHSHINCFQLRIFYQHGIKIWIEV